jgi:glycine cleavage system aminomethyltransferase T
VHVEDITAARACFGLWGPRSRAILQSLTKTDLSDEAFPYLRAREIAVGDVPCLVVRVTYVGELGYELYCPTEYGLALVDSLLEAGAPHGLVLAGYRAIDSLRVEKGYRAWGSDITPETTPESAGLGFAVRLDKPAPFLGRDALLAEQAAGGPAERLRCFVLDDPRAVCLGGEPVRLGGTTAGRVTSGAYGHRVGRSIAFAYLPAAASEPGAAVEVDLFGQLVAGTIVADPAYDAGNARIRS